MIEPCVTPLVCAVILNWNGADHTVPCVRSLLRQNYSNIRIVVVDNGSSDDSLQVLRSEFPSEIELLPLPENRGFTGGCNAGIDYVLPMQPDYVLLLNNDTECDADMVRQLVASAQAEARAGIVTAKIYSCEPGNILWFAGGDVQRGWMLRCLTRGYGEPDNGQWDIETESPFISGCCMLLPRAVLEQLGGFDDRFFAYVEDSDLCLRAAAAGYRLIYNPRAVMWHRESASIRKNAPDKKGGKDSPFLVYLGTRNRIILVRKHGTRREKAVMLMGYLLRALLRTPLLLRDGHMRATWRGLRDGLFTPLQGGAATPPARAAAP